MLLEEEMIWLNFEERDRYTWDFLKNPIWIGVIHYEQLTNDFI
jgi:hypothetical protein